MFDTHAPGDPVMTVTTTDGPMILSVTEVEDRLQVDRKPVDVAAQRGDVRRPRLGQHLLLERFAGPSCLRLENLAD